MFICVYARMFVCMYGCTGVRMYGCTHWAHIIARPGKHSAAQRAMISQLAGLGEKRARK